MLEGLQCTMNNKETIPLKSLLGLVSLAVLFFDMRQNEVLKVYFTFNMNWREKLSLCSLCLLLSNINYSNVYK